MNRYDLGDGSFLRSFKDGDQLVRALRLVSQETVSLRNIAKIQELVQKQCGLEDMSVVVEVPLNNFSRLHAHAFCMYRCVSVCNNT